MWTTQAIDVQNHAQGMIAPTSPTRATVRQPVHAARKA